MLTRTDIAGQRYGMLAVFGMMAGYMECAGEEDLADRLEEIANAM